MGRVVNIFLNPLLPQERSSSTNRVQRDTFVRVASSISSPLLWAGVLGRWAFLFLNQFGCVSPGIGLTFCYKLAEQRWIEGKIDFTFTGIGPSIDHGAYSKKFILSVT